LIPIRDSVPHRHFPYVNYILITINILIFIFEIALGSRLNGFLMAWAVTPTRFMHSGVLSFTRIAPLVTSTFLHGGFLHIGFNMLFLYIFGDNVEDAMGHFRYFFFYILVGILASLAHIYANPGSGVPSLGASGAIAGVLGAYIFMYPRAKIYTIIFLVVILIPVEIPAILFIGLWFLVQLASGFTSISQSSAAGGVAYFAHIGGFVSGFILILFFRKRSREDLMKYYS
jgi:membrane associated rhomboid family serine protease